jgi:hypothetical protein
VCLTVCTKANKETFIHRFLLKIKKYYKNFATFVAIFLLCFCQDVNKISNTELKHFNMNHDL